MREYRKPILIPNEELAEGIFAASGDNCYTFWAHIAQKPELGNPVYTIQIDGKHHAADGHHSSERTVIINFNLPVSYVSSNAVSVEGDGTTSLKLSFVDGFGSYHNNAEDNIGLGQLKVTAAEGLAITAVGSDFCNKTCTYGH